MLLSSLTPCRFFDVDQYRQLSIALGCKLASLKEDLLKDYDDTSSLVKDFIDHFTSRIHMPCYKIDDKLKDQSLLYEFLNKHQVPYQAYVFHELVYIPFSARVKKSFVAQPRASIHTALAFPGHYYEVRSSSKQNEISQHDDVSIAYNIYLESGNLINLRDWYTSFSSILDEGEELTNKEEKLVLARFIKAVTELNYCGFIKTTSRKTDHVERMTFGY